MRQVVAERPHSPAEEIAQHRQVRYEEQHQQQHQIASQPGVGLPCADAQQKSLKLHEPANPASDASRSPGSIRASCRQAHISGCRHWTTLGRGPTCRYAVRPHAIITGCRTAHASSRVVDGCATLFGRGILHDGSPGWLIHLLTGYDTDKPRQDFKAPPPTLPIPKRCRH